jgi:2-phosphoglycerate kinase
MNHSWKVLLIGGSAATGKSHLAKELAKHFGTTVYEVDDIRIALQVKLPQETFPQLFFFLNNPQYLNDFPVAVLVQNLQTVGREVWPSLKALIDKHIACYEPIIFEGDGILPELVAGLDPKDVKSIFVYDTKDGIEERELVRKRGGDNPNLAAQVDFSYAYGELIRQQAEGFGMETFQSSPIETLLERALVILEK